MVALKREMFWLMAVTLLVGSEVVSQPTWAGGATPQAAASTKATEPRSAALRSKEMSDDVMDNIVGGLLVQTPDTVIGIGQDAVGTNGPNGAPCIGTGCQASNGSDGQNAIALNGNATGGNGGNGGNCSGDYCTGGDGGNGGKGLALNGNATGGNGGQAGAFRCTSGCRAGNGGNGGKAVAFHGDATGGNGGIGGGCAGPSNGCPVHAGNGGNAVSSGGKAQGGAGGDGYGVDCFDTPGCRGGNGGNGGNGVSFKGTALGGLGGTGGVCIGACASDGANGSHGFGKVFK